MEYGWMMLRMLAVLAAVCALAYGLLRLGLRRFAPFNPSAQGRLEVVDRLGVAPKQSLLVVRTGGQFWLVGSSEAGLQMLGELDADPWRERDGDLDNPVSRETPEDGGAPNLIELLSKR